jgi:hypothetical protein
MSKMTKLDSWLAGNAHQGLRDLASAAKHGDHRTRGQERSKPEDPALNGRHKIISHGQDHRGGTGTRQVVVAL